MQYSKKILTSQYLLNIHTASCTTLKQSLLDSLPINNPPQHLPLNTPMHYSKTLLRQYLPSALSPPPPCITLKLLLLGVFDAVAFVDDEVLPLAVLQYLPSTPPTPTPTALTWRVDTVRFWCGGLRRRWGTSTRSAAVPPLNTPPLITSHTPTHTHPLLLLLDESTLRVFDAVAFVDDEVLPLAVLQYLPSTPPHWLLHTHPHTPTPYCSYLTSRHCAFLMRWPSSTMRYFHSQCCSTSPQHPPIDYFTHTHTHPHTPPPPTALTWRVDTERSWCGGLRRRWGTSTRSAAGSAGPSWRSRTRWPRPAAHSRCRPLGAHGRSCDGAVLVCLSARGMSELEPENIYVGEF